MWHTCVEKHLEFAVLGEDCAQGRWVWWLKNWIDRGFIKRYRRSQSHA
jgi:hypothetical protein